MSTIIVQKSSVTEEKTTNSAKNLFSKMGQAASDNLIEDLSREIAFQKRAYEENIKFRLTSERDVEILIQENEKLRIRLEQQRQLVNGKKKDPKKQAMIASMKESSAAMKMKIQAYAMTMSMHREELHVMRTKMVAAEAINDICNEKLKKHMMDIEDRISLEQKIQMAKESIGSLEAYQQKLNRMIEKYASKSGEKDIVKIEGNQHIIVKSNSYERVRLALEAEYIATGMNLYAVLEDARKLISRNNLINDKLPHTMGILKSDYILAILERFQHRDLSQSSGEQIEFSKSSVAYFFRQFMVEVKIYGLIREIEAILAEYERNKERLMTHSKYYLGIKVEDLTEQLIDEALKLNDEIREKMIQVRAYTKQYDEVVHLHRLGVDRFQEKIRIKCVQQVKERHKLSDILDRDGTNRVTANTATLRKLYADVERLLRFKWLHHKKGQFLDFRGKTMILQNENSDLTANFMVIKLVLDKIKGYFKDLDLMNIQKLDKLIQKLILVYSSLIKDHNMLVDVERRIKELQLEYDVMIKDISEESEKIGNLYLKDKGEQFSKLALSDQELSKYLDSKKNYLFSVKGNIDNDDLDTLKRLQVFESQLQGAENDEDQANEHIRQIQSKYERLFRWFQKIAPLKYTTLEEFSDIYDSLSGLDIHITNTQQVIDQAFPKVKDLDMNLREIEDIIRERRKVNCHESLMLNFASLEKLIKLIERHTVSVQSITDDQEKLKNNGFDDQEKSRDTTQFGLDLDIKRDQLIDY